MRHRPNVCIGSGTGLETALEISQDRRQVIEIPKPQPEVTEHQALPLACPKCELVTGGTYSPEVSQPVQHLPRTQAPGCGPRTKAAAEHLQTYTCPTNARPKRWATYLPAPVPSEARVFGVYPSEGTLASARATAYTALEGVEQAIRSLMA